MRIAEVIGRVTLSRQSPELTGARWLVGVPLSGAALANCQDGRADSSSDAGRGEPFIIYDNLGAGRGSLIAVSEGVEAAVPFLPKQVPIDAYNAAMLDHVEVEGLGSRV